MTFNIMPDPRVRVISANREEAIADSIAKNKQRKEDIARRLKREEEYLFGKPKHVSNKHSPVKVKSDLH